MKGDEGRSLSGVTMAVGKWVSVRSLGSEVRSFGNESALARDGKCARLGGKGDRLGVIPLRGSQKSCIQNCLGCRKRGKINFFFDSNLDQTRD